MVAGYINKERQQLLVNKLHRGTKNNTEINKKRKKRKIKEEKKGKATKPRKALEGKPNR